MSDIPILANPVTPLDEILQKQLLQCERRLVAITAELDAANKQAEIQSESLRESNIKVEQLILENKLLDKARGRFVELWDETRVAFAQYEKRCVPILKEAEWLRESCLNLISVGDEIVWAIENMIPTAMKEEKWKLLVSRVNAAIGDKQ